MTSYGSQKNIGKKLFPSKGHSGSREPPDKPDTYDNLKKAEDKKAEKAARRQFKMVIKPGWSCGGISPTVGPCHINYCGNDHPLNVPCVSNDCEHNRCDRCWEARIFDSGVDKSATGWFHFPCGTYYAGMDSLKHCTSCNHSAAGNFRYVCLSRPSLDPDYRGRKINRRCY